MDSTTIDVAWGLLQTDGKWLLCICAAAAVVGIGTMQFVVRPFWRKPTNVDARSRWNAVMPGIARLVGMVWCMFAVCAYFELIVGGAMAGQRGIQIVAAIPFAFLSAFLTPVIYDRLRAFGKKDEPPDDKDDFDKTRFDW